MSFLRSLLHVVTSVSCCLVMAAPLFAEQFEIRDGDRVVFLGDGLVEQEQYAGWVEVMMATAFPDRQFTVRHLGWSGDTPAGASRLGLSLLQAGYEPPDEGWKQLKRQLELTKPTVLVLGYGMAHGLEAADSSAHSAVTFRDDFRRLLQTAREIDPDVRFLFLTPLNHLDANAPTAESIEQHAAVVCELAEEWNSALVDLRDFALDASLRQDLIHLNDSGYRQLAIHMQTALGWDGLAWQTSSATESLRQAILQKNEWWFHRSRPANMAYVFGFRKHEQGQNAGEIPQFDALVQAEEARIAGLKHLVETEIAPVAARTESAFAKFTPQPTPEFTIDDDFEVTLWAENPQLNKPIQINFDSAGRLWVASSEAYPMIEVGQVPPDKILVLEDTNGNGQADKSTVFADGLLIPTGVEPGDGGVYVAQSTDLLFLKDTDGDGKADLKRRVLTGFGTEDTHHNLHTLRWGFDGRLYMNQSVYTRSNLETPHGVTRLNAGGGFRYHTESMRTQIFFRGLWNSWGHQFDRFGQSFLSDGAGFQGLAYALPGAAFRPTPGGVPTLDLISPGNYPKFASLEIIEGPSFPESWQGSLIACDFRANRITRFSLRDDGAGFVTRQEDDLLRSSATSFRPIDVKQGPDGALYIADWSNPIINHGEVDFRDERRDRWHGRIWRVAWKGSEAERHPNLAQLPTPQLLDHLLSDDRYLREQSRRVLIERRDISDELADWTKSHVDQPHAQLQAMWMQQALGNLQSLPLTPLHATDPRIRAAAVRVIGDFADPHCDYPERLDWATTQSLLAPRVIDPNPRVRLEAIRALGAVGPFEAAKTALQSLDRPVDRFIEYALGLTVRELSAPLLNSIEQNGWSDDSELGRRQLEFVVTAVDAADAARVVSRQVALQPIRGDGPWIELIGKAGGQPELDKLCLAVTATEQGRRVLPDATAARALDALLEAARVRKLRPTDAAAKPIIGLLDDPRSSIRQPALRLLGAWQEPSAIDRIYELSANSSANIDLEERQQAISALVSIGGPQVARLLTKLTDVPAEPQDETAVAIRRAAVLGLSRVDLPQSIEPFFALLGEIEPESAKLALWRNMLQTRGSGPAIASADSLAQLATSAANAGIKACRDGGRDEPALLAALQSRVAELSTDSAPVTVLSAADLDEILRQVPLTGDAVQGERIYLRQELACVTCHAVGGVGGRVGPDMTSLGASAPLDYLLESMVDPDAKIKENYHAVSVVTESGLVINGIETESNDRELVLRNANNELVRIPKSDVLETQPSKSLMPSGLLDRLSPQERIDLLTFLSQLGKPGDFDATQGGVAREFEVLAGTHRLEQQGVEPIINGEPMQGWLPLVSRINGDVEVSRLQTLTKQPINIAQVHVYLRTGIEMLDAGPVRFRLATDNDTAALWVDGSPVMVDESGEFATRLSTGAHTVLVRLDARQLPETFRLSSSDVRFVAPAVRAAE